MIAENQDNDQILLSLFQNGNQSAFESIYRTHAADLIAFARKNVGIETAEEIIQDVFVSLWMRRAELQVTSFRAYLFSSVRYRLIRHVKHEKVKRKYEDHYRLFEAAYENTPEPKRNPEALSQKINALTMQLPERCRQALHLRLTENLSNTEIAQRMHISKRTVETYISQAFDLLRQYPKDLLEIV
ncbi:MAG: sigma-70 family RNA polymerase sigma factor [Cytophagales bacterium]|nr:sigma-70 family RNA polymerase sigma factor [Cytophagales bacterium]